MAEDKPFRNFDQAEPTLAARPPKRSARRPLWLVLAFAAGELSGVGAGLLVGWAVWRQPTKVVADIHAVDGNEKNLRADLQRYYRDPSAKMRVQQALMGQPTRVMVSAIGPPSITTPFDRYTLWRYPVTDPPKGKSDLCVYVENDIVTGFDLFP